MISHTTALLFSNYRPRVFSVLMAMALTLVTSVTPGDAQRVYGVASRTTVVHGGSTTVVRRTTVATGGAHAVALPSGYIAVLPGGYRAVGGGIYMAGSVRYRATFYQGRTVYIRL